MFLYKLTIAHAPLSKDNPSCSKMSVYHHKTVAHSNNNLNALSLHAHTHTHARTSGFLPLTQQVLRTTVVSGSPVTSPLRTEKDSGSCLEITKESNNRTSASHNQLCRSLCLSFSLSSFSAYYQTIYGPVSEEE